MTKHEKQIIAVSVTLAACLGVSFTANAMHIMEGALPAGYCIAWGLILSSISSGRILLNPEGSAGKQKSADSSRHVRSLCLCNFLP